MTTPQYDADATLPPGVLRVGDLGSAMQGLNGAKVTETTKGRMVGNFLATPGGFAGGPIDFLVGLLGQFLGGIADDANDITLDGPQDLPDLVHDFFEDLPLVGVLVDIYDAMLGTYTGDDPIFKGIQSIFALLRKLLEIITNPSGDLIDEATTAVEGFFDNLKTLLAGGDVTSADGWFEGLSKLPGFGDLIEIITGVEDGDLDDLGTWINGLKTILSGGTVAGLPTLGGALNLGGLQTMLQQIADILNGLVVTPINSAVQGVKDWFAGLVGWRSTTDTSVATAASNAASASTAAANAQSAVTQVAANINNAISGGVAAGSGAIAQAFDTIASIFGLASSANAAAISAQTQLAAQQNGSDSNTSGFSWSTQFSGSDGALSSSDWTTNGIQIVDGTGYAGIPSGSATGYYYALAKYLLTTDTDSAVMTLGTLNGGNSSSFGGADYYTGLGIRCNADFTAGAFCRVNKSGIAIGKFTRSGTSISFSVLSSASMTINAGDVVRFKASGSNYYALVNGSTKLSVTDSGGTIPVGASYRSAGFFEQRASNVFFTDNSFRVASFGMSDWKDGSAAVTTPSWRLRRGTTTMATLSVAGGSSAAMPSEFFTVQDQLTAATVTSLGLGQVTITTAGWYEIGFTAVATVSVTNGDPRVVCPWGLYVGSTLVQAPIAGGTRTVVYLAVGDVVSPHAVASTPATSAAANTNGTSGANMIANTNNAAKMTSAIESIGGPAATFTGRFLAAA